MHLTVYRVQNLNRGRSYLAGLDHFELQKEGRLPAATLLTRPNLSLYSLDDASSCAVFVETSPGVDLTAAPFYYLAQKEHARRVLTVPYKTFNTLAADLPKTEHLLLLYSVGRCGSTLLCHALGDLGEVTTLSEPDVYTHIAGMRPADGSRDPELTQLAKSATRFLHHQTPEQRTLLLKFRSQGIEMADLLHAACPNAQALFLTRDFTGWLRSVGRMSKIHDPEREASFQRNKANPTMFIYPRERYISLLRETTTPPSTRLEDIAFQWISVMKRFLDLHQRGIIPHALNYDDLVREPEAVLRAVAAICHFETDKLGNALEVFKRDSQEGTNLSGRRLREQSEHELTEVEVQQAHSTVRRFGLEPTITHALPGNLLV